jgi:uncharacterized membrane protein YkvA (DUF1232 family)
MFKFGLFWARFRKELILAWAILRDSRTPASAKLATIAAIWYVLSPIDLVTDLIPILGWLDDGIVVILLLKLAQRLLPSELLEALQAKIMRQNRS